MQRNNNFIIFTNKSSSWEIILKSNSLNKVKKRREGSDTEQFLEINNFFLLLRWLHLKCMFHISERT